MQVHRNWTTQPKNANTQTNRHTDRHTLPHRVKLFVNQSAGGTAEQTYLFSRVKSQSEHKLVPTQDKLPILSICAVMPPEQGIGQIPESPEATGERERERWGQH